MATGTVTGDASLGTDTLRSIESINATNFDDVYDATGYGSLGALNFSNNGTSNQFQGLGGNDTIIGNGNTQILYNNATAGIMVDLALGIATGDASVGTDTILGGVARVNGSNFADSILGDGNNNNLSGQGGNDWLDGRAGNDTLTGGPGADTFAYTMTADGLDNITDFNGHGGQNDVLAFDHLAFGDGLAMGGANTGTLDASHFIADGTGPTDAAHIFWYNTNDRTLYYDADGSGGDLAVAIATLNNGFVLDHTDLVLI
jgi:Ca2+-binding RTX toxin-like protein